MLLPLVLALCTCRLLLSLPFHARRTRRRSAGGGPPSSRLVALVLCVLCGAAHHVAATSYLATWCKAQHEAAGGDVRYQHLPPARLTDAPRGAGKGAPTNWSWLMTARHWFVCFQLNLQMPPEELEKMHHIEKHIRKHQLKVACCYCCCARVSVCGPYQGLVWAMCG